MSASKNADTVKVHYTGELENGEVFDQSTEGDPLKFTLGNGSIISGFEKGVVGIEAGQQRLSQFFLKQDMGHGTKNW